MSSININGQEVPIQIQYSDNTSNPINIESGSGPIVIRDANALRDGELRFDSWQYRGVSPYGIIPPQEIISITPEGINKSGEILCTWDELKEVISFIKELKDSVGSSRVKEELSNRFEQMIEDKNANSGESK